MARTMYDHEKIRDLIGRCQADFTLPQAFYSDADLFAFDMAEVFTNSWLLVAFEAELPVPGAYLALTVGRNPIVLVRGRDQAIRAFHNTCRHRGSQICADGRGRSSNLVCPYHHWTYALDGRLIGAARMPADFSSAEYSLNPVAVGRAAGCIYIAIGPGAPDFAPFGAAICALLAPYRLAEAKLAHENTLVEKANWKLVMENARECYHCASAHPELGRSFPVMIRPNFTFEGAESGTSFAERMDRLGLAHAPVEGSWWHAARYPLNPGMESISMDGKPVVARRLIDIPASAIGGVRWAAEPNSFCHALPEYCFTFTAIPTGPEETKVISKWYVHRDAVEGVDYDVDKLTETWNRTNLQDRSLAENNQRGVNGYGYVPGPYSRDAEDFVIRFARWYRAQLRIRPPEGSITGC
jgi:Rieske 2Fe-2S family protein